MDLLEDISEFFQAFSGMVGGFQERAKRVNELLADKRTSFLVVCGPQGEPIEEAVYFHRKLVEAALPFGGVIVNKVHYASELEAASDDVEPELPRSARRPGPGAHAPPPTSPTTEKLAARDSANIDAPDAEMRARRVIKVPYLDEDVHDLGGLMEVNRYLFATAQEREALAAGERLGPRVLGCGCGG